MVGKMEIQIESVPVWSKLIYKHDKNETVEFMFQFLAYHILSASFPIPHDVNTVFQIWKI